MATDVPQDDIRLQSGQSALVITDLPGPAGGIRLELGSACISITDEGIVISNGKGASITMVGPTVSINDGALSVT